MREASELKERILDCVNNPENGIVKALDTALSSLDLQLEIDGEQKVRDTETAGIVLALYGVLNRLVAKGIITREEIQNKPSNLYDQIDTLNWLLHEYEMESAFDLWN